MKTIFVLLLSPFYCGGPQLIGPTVHIKPIFFLFFARNNWSYLLCPPAIVVTQPRGHIVSTPLRGTTENRTYGTHNDLRISLFSLTTFGLIYYAPPPHHVLFVPWRFLYRENSRQPLLPSQTRVYVRLPAHTRRSPQLYQPLFFIKKSSQPHRGD